MVGTLQLPLLGWNPCSVIKGANNCLVLVSKKTLMWCYCLEILHKVGLSCLYMTAQHYIWTVLCVQVLKIPDCIVLYWITTIWIVIHLSPVHSKWLLKHYLFQASHLPHQRKHTLAGPLLSHTWSVTAHCHAQASQKSSLSSSEGLGKPSFNTYPLSLT